MKKILLSLALIGSIVTGVFADNVYYTTASTLNTNLANYPLLVNQVTISSSASTNVTVWLIDSKNSSQTYTNNVYQSITTTIGTITNIYTNFVGTIQTNTYTGMQSTTVTNAAATNNLPIVAVLSVPANTTITYTPSGFYRFMNGLLVTNLNGVTFSASYSRW
jgi:hypothetical protein